MQARREGWLGIRSPGASQPFADLVFREGQLVFCKRYELAPDPQAREPQGRQGPAGQDQVRPDGQAPHQGLQAAEQLRRVREVLAIVEDEGQRVLSEHRIQHDAKFRLQDLWSSRYATPAVTYDVGHILPDPDEKWRP